MRHIKKTPLKYLALLCFVVLTITVAVLELTNTTFLLHDKEVPFRGTASSETKGESEQQTNSAPPKDTSSQPRDNKITSDANSETIVTLLVPSGTYASNHHPSLSANQDQSSSCNTTPGATCKISFNKDGVVKSLVAQGTDRGGSTYWTWRPKDIGLSQGNWRITAESSMNSQVKTADDALLLEVSP